MDNDGLPLYPTTNSSQTMIKISSKAPPLQQAPGPLVQQPTVTAITPVSSQNFCIELYRTVFSKVATAGSRQHGDHVPVLLRLHQDSRQIHDDLTHTHRCSPLGQIVLFVLHPVRLRFGQEFGSLLSKLSEIPRHLR
ncbi:unnamed protein product [Chrysodeixis includens]|uniref:Uncharacterized protein n=1 Tax=Chrysodeixis includens TaxID=689277 RepID=A0A9N8PZH8_CHRIL|nr:unnamed protein product [Chrysodeixis includens]